MVNSLKGKDIEIKILKDTNRIDPSSVTTDWNDQTADITLTGTIKEISFEEPQPTRETITYLGSDSNGVQLQESYISEWGSGKLSGTMVVNPDADGNYLALDDLFLSKVAEDNTTNMTANYVYGAEITTNADFLVAIGKNYGVRLLFKDFKFNKLNAFSANDKGPIEVSFEVETLAGSAYIQKKRL